MALDEMSRIEKTKQARRVTLAVIRSPKRVKTYGRAWENPADDDLIWEKLPFSTAGIYLTWK